MLPESIVMRAEVHIKNGIEPVKAIELAFDEEQNMILSLINRSMNLSPKGNYVANELVKSIYQKLNAK